jgi:hypothetical protein
MYKVLLGFWNLKNAIFQTSVKDWKFYFAVFTTMQLSFSYP